MPVIEVIYMDRAVWQEDEHATLQCPECLRAIFTQTDPKRMRVVNITCNTPRSHAVEWEPIH